MYLPHDEGEIAIKVLVCGSRKFNDPLTATATIVKRVAALPEYTLVIQGDAGGADRIAAAAAKRVGLGVMSFPADWERHSLDCRCREHLGWCREAGKRRNLKMLDEEPDLVIAFWNGSSTGTLHTITKARARGIEVEVVRLR